MTTTTTPYEERKNERTNRVAYTRDPDVTVRWLHGLDNPHVPADVLEKILSQFGEHEQAARRRGDFTMLDGLVYAAWRRDLHVVPHATTPLDPSWPRIVGIDFGTRNPACWLWVAHDTTDDTLHVYREHYKEGWLTSQHAEHFHSVYAFPSTEPRPSTIVADSEDLQARIELASKHGIASIPARKDVRPGINAVAERLRLT